MVSVSALKTALIDHITYLLTYLLTELKIFKSNTA